MTAETRETLERIAYAVEVSIDELLESREAHYTYMPGACIACGAVYVDVHRSRRGHCRSCETPTVWPWIAIADGIEPTSVAVRNTCYRAEPRLEVVR